VHPEALPFPPPERVDRTERDRQLAAWLAEAAQGSSGAFEQFHDATVAHARTLARRMLRGPQRDSDCDDLLADAYFEAWRNLARFDAARGGAVTWLLQIVRSRALDLLRRQAAHAAEPLAAEAHEAGHEEDAAQRLWQQQAGTRLHAALSRLTAPERWVLGLAYFRELSHTEIAAATGLPLGTVKSHVQRAQVKLRAALAD
jgi:RNA polymerase sigma-70 factor, ECF subfamily